MARWSAVIRGVCSYRWSTDSSSPRCCCSTCSSTAACPDGHRLLSLDHRVQPVRGGGVLEFHGRCLQQRGSPGILRVTSVRPARWARSWGRSSPAAWSAASASPNLMLISAAFLCLCVVCLLRLRLWAVAHGRDAAYVAGEKPMGGDVLAGLKLIVREPLRWLAVMVVFGVGVGTLLYTNRPPVASSIPIRPLAPPSTPRSTSR